MENSPFFIDTLKVADGKFIHPELHLLRIQQTQHEVFGHHSSFSLSDNLIPEEKRHGIVKCRITYSQTIHQINFDFYRPRSIGALKLVESNNLDYH